MKNLSCFNKTGLLPLLLSKALLASVMGLTIAIGLTFLVHERAYAEIWYGLYTDATSYAPKDTIEIYGSAPDEKIVFRLVRLDTEWTEVVRTKSIMVGPQPSYLGSFIEYPDVTLSGRTSFTLEGWLYPTLLGGDLVVVAGQVGMTEAAAGIVIFEDPSNNVRLAAYVSNTPQTNPARLAIAPEPLKIEKWLDSWHHLAMTYDGANVKLYVDGALKAQRAQTGPVAKVSAPFRLGARSEAPGDLTGVIDGRLDSWTLWPTALSVVNVEARRDRGLSENDPAPLDPADVDLYVGFEGPYPSIADTSHNQYSGSVVNHGKPGVAGVGGKGHAFRLNHDKIVDAGWNVTAELTIPSDTPSGMYAVHAFPADSIPTQQGDPLFAHAIAVRPGPTDPRATIAVVLPTNTWTVYNSWPGGPVGKSGPGIITTRSRYPGGDEIKGGENTLYFVMGDGVSRTHYHGLHRPSIEASPVKPGPEVAEYTVRAPNSMYLMQWLDAQGFDYDVYSDNDFDAGVISASDYRVLMPHSHHEYWTDGMLETLTRFLDDGGSVVAPAGNIFTWRAVYGPGGVVEAHRKSAQIIGVADLYSGIDGTFIGLLKQSAICNGGGNYYGSDRFRALGVEIHYTHPCGFQNRMYGGPFCLGKWAASNTDHWLWQGSGLKDNDRFGFGRLATNPIRETNALGHEADTWVEGMPLPGLAEGQRPMILAVGTGLTNYSDRVINLLDTICTDPPTCNEIIDLALGIITPPPEAPGCGTTWPEIAGTILYFPHNSGGHVLVIGASATPWALKNDDAGVIGGDAALSGLLQRALDCFAYDNGCGGLPLSDIKANGSDGQITLGTSDTLLVNINLAAGGSSGVESDWWVVADTPFGWFYFDARTMSWAYAGSSYTDLSPTYQGQLSDLNPFEVLNMSTSRLPEGKYTFYFAVDTKMNSLLDLDLLYYDNVVVNIKP